METQKGEISKIYPSTAHKIEANNDLQLEAISLRRKVEYLKIPRDESKIEI
jgi:hypothetical protein